MRLQNGSLLLLLSSLPLSLQAQGTSVFVPAPPLWVNPANPWSYGISIGPGYSGVVEQIARAAEFTPRNVQTVGERIKQVFGIKVRLDNREGKLRAGMAADVTFPNVAAP